MSWNQGQPHNTPPLPPPPGGGPGYGGAGNRSSYYAPAPGPTPGYPASPVVQPPSGYAAGGGNRNSYYGAPPGTGPGPVGYQASPAAQQSPTGQPWGGQQPGSSGYPGYPSQQQQTPGYSAPLSQPQQHGTPAPNQAGAYSPQTYNPQGYNPQTYNPQTYNPQTYNPQTYAPHSYNPHTYTPQAPQNQQMNIPQPPQNLPTSSPQAAQPYSPPIAQTQAPTVHPPYSAQSPQSYAPPTPQSYPPQPAHVQPNTQPNIQQTHSSQPYTSPISQTYTAQSPQTYPPAAPHSYSPQTSQPYSPQPTQTPMTPAPQTYSPQNPQNHPPPASQSYTTQTPTTQPHSSQQHTTPAPQTYAPQASQSYTPQVDTSQGTQAYIPPTHTPAPQTPQHPQPYGSPYNAQPPTPQTQSTAAPPTYQPPQPHSAQTYTPQPYTPDPPSAYQTPFHAQQMPPPPLPPQKQDTQPTYQPSDTTLEQQMNDISLNDRPLSGFPSTGTPQTTVDEKKPGEAVSYDGEVEKLHGKKEKDEGTYNPFANLMPKQETVVKESTPFKVQSGLPMTTMSVLHAHESGETNPFKPLLASQTDAPTQAASEPAITETNPFKLASGVPSQSPGASYTSSQPGLPYPSPENQRHTPPAAQLSRRRERQGAMACIRFPATFPTTWYTHPQAPRFNICSRCYEDHIAETLFEHAFHGVLTQDGQPRSCLFGKPLYIDMYNAALLRNNLDEFVEFIQFRSEAPNCMGVDGVNATVGVEWFVAEDNAIPNMVVCRACVQDYVISRPSLSPNFIPCPTKQDDNAVWSCDFAVPFIWKEYLEKGETGDWAGFCSEARQRIGMDACPKFDAVQAHTRRWFKPTSGLDGLLICGACYADRVHHSEEHSNWCPAENVTETVGDPVSCALGQLNLAEAMEVAHELNDMGVFWRAAVQVIEEPICHVDGMSKTQWHTLKSNPDDFAICGGCYYGMIEPWGVTHLFMEKPDTDASTTLLCSFNREAPRLVGYMMKAAEAFYRRMPKVLADYIEEYAGIPPCARDQDFKERKWFGWDECTICPECYHDVVRGTTLADSMPLRGDPISSSRLCELYSPKMRALYAEACTSSSPTALLTASLERRAVYFQTVPLIRRMVIESQFQLAQQRILDAVSSMYDLPGELQQTVQTGYGVVGGGQAGSASQLQETLLGWQAEGVARSLLDGDQRAVVKVLEERWRDVE